MGESRVMTEQREFTDEELFIERLEIVDSEQSGGSESGGDGSEIIWHDGSDGSEGSDGSSSSEGSGSSAGSDE
jgi:hypothetical protein